MKLPLKIFSLSLLILAGCSKDTETIAPAPLNSGPKTLSMFNMVTGENVPVAVNFPADAIAPTSIQMKANGNVHTINGHWLSEGGNLSTMSVVQNNGGIHGNIQVSGTFDFSMQSECILVDGNAGVYGGLITSVTDAGGNPGVAVGNYVYLKVVDNGEGENAAPQPPLHSCAPPVARVDRSP